MKEIAVSPDPSSAGSEGAWRDYFLANGMLYLLCGRSMWTIWSYSTHFILQNKIR